MLFSWSRRLSLARPWRLPAGLAALTGVAVLSLVAAQGWQRHLSGRLAEAAAQGDFGRCLDYGNQLRRLAWLPGAPPSQEGRCRREQAARLWGQQRWAEAVGLQRQLVRSADGLPADRQRLDQWSDALRRRALDAFRRGELKAALAALAPLGEDRRADGDSLGDQLQQAWSRNRLEAERAERLVGQARWWEALESLNRLDHPWWQSRSQPLRQRVNQGIAQLKGREREHDGHGAPPHTVPQARLEAEVERRIAAGMDDWKAFEAGCRALGGQVVEVGPESICRQP